MAVLRKDRKDQQVGADAEAAAAATAIAGLRWRLSREATLEDPVVRRELRKLEEQLAAQLELAGRGPGRHRFAAEGLGQATISPVAPPPAGGDDVHDTAARCMQ